MASDADPERAPLVAWYAGQDDVEKIRPKTCCRCCLDCCCFFLVLLAALECLFLLALALMSIGVDLQGTQCGILEYRPDEVDRALIMGTQSNVLGDRWYKDPGEGFDLTGLWWIKWGDENIGVKIYGSWRLEVAVTFANSTQWDVAKQQEVSPAKPVFPMIMWVPAMEPHTWAYSNSWPALRMLLAHAKWIGGHFEFDFFNKTTANEPGQGPMYQLNEDQWVRENMGGRANYKLTRIMYADGSKHPVYWQQWLDHMFPYGLRVWGNEDSCRRHCEVVLAYFGATGFLRCRVCYRFCS